MNKVISIYRSPVYRKYKLESVTLRELNGFMAPMTITNADDAIDSAKKLMICDVSWLPRTGFKGKDTIKWLAGRGMKLPEKANSLEQTSDGSLIIRLGITEFLIITDPNRMGELAVELSEEWAAKKIESVGTNTYCLPRQDSHACFSLCGDYAPQLFGKLCAIDFRANHFPNLGVVQTSIARLSSIIVRNDLSGTLSYLIFTDCTSAEYLWDCILDAGQEFECRVDGYDSILKLKNEKKNAI
jgi:sarcosine oxidase subunit gamma